MESTPVLSIEAGGDTYGAGGECAKVLGERDGAEARENG